MLADLWNTLAGPAERIAPVYLVAFVCIAFVIYVVRARRHGETGFLRWLFPRAIYLHRSHITDIKLFLFGRLVSFTGAVSTVGLLTLASAAVVSVANGLGIASVSDAPWSPVDMVIVTLIILVVGDFCTYWVHRLHHDLPVLWPFHAVHHSAEVMTPLTVYRKHPVYDLISSMTRSLLTGLAVGLILLVVTDSVNIVQLGGINAGYFLFHLLGSNFRHSHIWISYGRALEHVFISPAQHQIHHSRAIAHHDRNHGEVFALWDWMFGTLYIPDHQEEIEYGLADSRGEPLDQPHGTLSAALIVPFRHSYARLKSRAPAKQIGQAPQR